MHIMIFTLDTYQNNAVKIIEQNDNTVVSGPKSSGKSYLIRYLARQRWSNGSNCLIIAPDVEHGKLLQKHLGAFEINKYSILFNESAESIKNIITKIKGLQNEEKIDISKQDLSSNNLILQNIHEKISDYYDHLNKILIQGKSFSELLTISAFDSNSYTNIHFNQIFDSNKFDFSEAEFNDISNKVKTAFELHEKGENKNDVYFSRKSYAEKTADKAWPLIVHWLENSRIKILKSIELLSVFLNEQVNTIFELEWKKIREDLVNADNCLLECNTFNIHFQDFIPKNPGLFGTDKRTKELNEKYHLSKQRIQYDYKNLIRKLDLNPRIKDNYNLPDPESEKIEEIKTNLENIINDQVKFENILLNSIKKELKSVNFRNIRNPYTENLQSELKVLFTILNEGYAVKKWEDTAFSINKQLNYLESILEDLNEIEGQKINFFSNYSWNTFLSTCDEKSEYLIKKLNIYRPKNWLIFVRNWYIQNIILKNQKKFAKDLKEIISEFEKRSVRKEELNTLRSAKIWQNKRDIYLNKLEDHKNNPVRKMLLQDDLSLTIEELINNSDEFLTTFTPVVIITPDLMEKYKNTLQNKFDIIIYFNTNDFKDKIEVLLPEQYIGKIVFFTEDTDISATVKNSLWKLSYQTKLAETELKGYHQQGMIELLDMNNTERLYAARNLAYMMQSTNMNLKIFHMKNKIIFSSLDDILNKVLFKLLENQGIKEMKIIDTPFHLLVDSILEINNKQVVITQNHLLNYKKTDNVLWQVYVIDKIKKAGIKVINFDSTDLLHEPISSVKEFISTI
ncbi:MAG: hypothetical protein IPH57_15160 [Saprospiraceae bacterium]|nr:hypothetical protein [Saprospiraceae bacterium]